MAACDIDIPTELPEFESRWVVPAEETRFGVADLLPGDVTVSPDGSAFLVDFDPVAVSRTLGDLCSACALADGLTVPKPPFMGTVESDVDFPAEVLEINVLSGTVALDVTNDFGFDPINPAAGAEGLMTLRVTDSADGDVLAELVVDGADTDFPSGTTLSRNLPLAPTEVNGGLLATVHLDSPLGDDVTVDASAQLGLVATSTNVRVASVDVDVSNKSVTVEAVALEVEDVEESLSDRIVEGAFLLDVVNPFGVGASLDISITGPTIAPIQRPITVEPAASSSLTVAFTGDELRSFLGEPDVELTGTGAMDAGAGVLTLVPGDELVLDASIDLTLSIGGGD